jgi:SAM-dependent methyltransferase
MSDVDLRSIDPATRARHLGNPEGPVGIAIADSIAVLNRRLNEVAFALLAPSSGDRILEIGCGNGKLVPDLLRCASGPTYDGLDISETMKAEAIKANPATVQAGTTRFHVGSSDAMPFADGTFDRALVINVIYFWADPLAHLREIARALRAKGRLVLASVTARYAATMPFTQHGFRIHEGTAIRDLLTEAGFPEVRLSVERHMAQMILGDTHDREFNMLVAEK